MRRVSWPLSPPLQMNASPGRLLRCLGADGGTRTRTPRGAEDFKSPASTGSATSARLSLQTRRGQNRQAVPAPSAFRKCVRSDVEADAHFLAGLEIGHALRRNLDGLAG